MITLNGSKTLFKYKTRSANQLKTCLLITACALSTNVQALSKTYVDKDSSLASNQVDWTGFYAGGVLGGLWGKNTGTWNPLPSPQAFGANKITGNINSSGFFGGILAGYNYQFNSLIAGVEGDWSWANSRGSLVSAPWLRGTTVTVPASHTTLASTLNWLPSIRGRIGYPVLPNLMVYGAAGVTWANINYAADSANGRNIFPYITNTSFSKTSSGYTIGAGLEWAVVYNFLLRAEYLYYQFSSAQNVIAPDTTGIFPTFPSNYVWGNTSVNAVRAGVVYKFNG